jgi:hypothetical protein
MAGGNYVLAKGFKALSTYASSDANGVQAGRFVKVTANQDEVDRSAAANTVITGVTLEDVDQADVATGKVVIGVQILGIAKVTLGGNVSLGAEVMSDTSGRAVTAATTGNRVCGVCLQGGSSGDLVDVLLTPAGRVIP